MDSKPKMANVGTAERPVMVPEKALYPQTQAGREWWGMIAEGSVVVDDEALDLLLAEVNEQQNSG